MKATCSRSLVATVVASVLALVLLPSVAEAEAADAVTILGIAWTPTPNPALVVSASGPLRYTETRPTPGVMVVDFPDAKMGSAVEPVSEPAAGLVKAILAGVEEGGRTSARLRIEYAPEAHLIVSALPAGVEVRIDKAGKGPARQPELLDVLAVADATGVSVHLASQGPIEGKSFVLADPPRVVVDLRGVINRVPKREHPVGAAGVRRVRIAQFSTMPEPIVRVVVDLEKDARYRLESTEHGAMIRVGDEPPAVVAAVAPKPPVEPKPAATEAAAAGAPAAGTTEAAPAAQPTATGEAAAGTPVTPVTIVEAPGPEATPTPAATAQQPTVTPVEAPPAAGQAPLTAPPATPTAESPWTTTPAAMAEQAGPPTTVSTISKEVESQEKKYTGEPISLEMKDADIKDVLRTFAKITGLNIVVDPDVSGSVTVQLDNVPWDQCLDIILRINRLDAVVENNVLRVAKLDRLTQEKQAMAQFKKEEDSAKPMRTVTKTLSYAKAAAVANVIKQQNFIVSDRGSVVVDDRTNQLIIRDLTDRIDGILNLIDTLDQPNAQVIIEARIVETTRTFSRKLGMSWGFTGVADPAHGNTSGWTFPYSGGATGGVGLGGNLAVGGSGAAGLEKPGGNITMVFADILDAFNLDFTLSAAESNGLAKIVSSPKVTTQNNEKAHIQSGVQVPIQTVANNTVTVQYIDATLSLDVTPQITAEGTVMLDIDIRKREPLAGVNITGGTNVPLSTRDAKTKVLVRDGGTTVIGGIYQFTDNDSRNSVPGLSKIPILGVLFRNKDLSEKHDELLIFITPRIVKY